MVIVVASVKSVIQVQILDEASHVSLYTDGLGKIYEAICFLSSYEKIVEQLVYKKKTSRFKPAVLCLKNDHLLHPTCGRGVW